ncbi:hypothetical protein DFH06DRAFT_1137159 [Mycena polygramma]|nr:hypothetical protein DFH06DRAFT_1137159 [Mycena polygramma]
MPLVLREAKYRFVPRSPRAQSNRGSGTSGARCSSSTRTPRIALQSKSPSSAAVDRIARKAECPRARSFGEGTRIGFCSAHRNAGQREGAPLTSRAGVDDRRTSGHAACGGEGAMGIETAYPRSDKCKRKAGSEDDEPGGGWRSATNEAGERRAGRMRGQSRWQRRAAIHENRKCMYVYSIYPRGAQGGGEAKGGVRGARRGGPAGADVDALTRIVENVRAKPLCDANDSGGQRTGSSDEKQEGRRASWAGVNALTRVVENKRANPVTIRAAEDAHRARPGGCATAEEARGRRQKSVRGRGRVVSGMSQESGRRRRRAAPVHRIAYLGGVDGGRGAGRAARMQRRDEFQRPSSRWKSGSGGAEVAAVVIGWICAALGGLGRGRGGSILSTCSCPEIVEARVLSRTQTAQSRHPARRHVPDVRNAGQETLEGGY